jgi:hypothetical protein
MTEPNTVAVVARRWRITAVILGLLVLLTRHHSLQQPVHVGMFAGSLLQRGDWDH